MSHKEMTIEAVKQIRQRSELCAEATVPREYLLALCDLALAMDTRLQQLEEELGDIKSECDGEPVIPTIRALDLCLTRVAADVDKSWDVLRSVLSLCRDKSFPGTMNMRLDEIEQHICKALREG